MLKAAWGQVRKVLENANVTVYQIDPLEDPRWQRLSLRHPNASVFHTPAWLATLRRTYQYEPLALTTSPPGSELTNGIVFCRINSWLTGKRLVSLPFSDHCEPLLNHSDDLGGLLSRLKADHAQGKWKYIEIRPISSACGMSRGFAQAQKAWLHRIDLRRTAESLFGSLHANLRRNIRQAARECLRHESANSPGLLQDFYGLLTLTRRRHGVPPQPLSWFRFLLDQMGANANLSVAYKERIPVAGILTLRHNDVLVYKYGCFDYRYRHLAGLTSLLWNAIRAAQHSGAIELDLGRSDYEDSGLISYKDRWASTRSPLTYWRYGVTSVDSAIGQGTARFGHRIIAHMPDKVLSAAGGLLYKHIG